MSIGIKCDLCGIPISSTETCNVFQMRSCVRLVQIEQHGLASLPLDENFYLCDNCMEKAWELLMGIKAVKR